VVHLVEVHLEREEGICASNNKLYLLLDLPHSTLRDELDARKQ
jgi:hypothetical protein